MPDFSLRAPGKSFLVGEYAVLEGGPALLAATPPYFRLEYIENSEAENKNIKNMFHPESPAGKLWAEHEAKIQHDLQFIDPYAGKGGFGASSAQFVLLARYLGYDDAWQIWRKYRDNAGMASGADVMAQCLGGLTFFFPREQKACRVDFLFADISLVFIHTGDKLATHVHLAQIAENLTEGKISANLSSLENIVLKTRQAIEKKQSEKFAEAIGEYGQILKACDLVAATTEVLLEKILARPEVLAAKGCGALGADVILVVLDRVRENLFLKWAHDANLNMTHRVRDNHDLAEGTFAT